MQEIERKIVAIAEISQQMSGIAQLLNEGAANRQQQIEQCADMLETANERLGETIPTARKSRPVKWHCALLGAIVILVVLALVLGIHFGLKAKHAN